MLRKSAGKLFLKFLAFLIPVFLLLCTLGLISISRLEMRADSAELTARVGNLAARISTALGRRDAEQIAAMGDDFVGAMMADPSVICAEVRFGKEPPRIRAPRVVGCTNSGEAQQLDLPFGNAGGILTVRFSTQELETSSNRRVMFLIVALLGSLFAAVFAGAVGFRQVIGLPLSRLREAIAESSASGKPVPVDYRGADEMGGVIAAYNELQLRHQKAEESFRSEASLRQM